MELSRLGIAALRKLLADGDVSPLDVARDTVEVVQRRDGELGAYLAFDEEGFLGTARAMTAAGAYRTLPLGGVPIAVKDNICVAGKQTTCGSRILQDYTSPFDATVVERLVHAGALVTGKTNCDEFAMGSSNENSAYGPTRNPWNPKRVPGGSSGGSAAAVAAGMAHGALGSDTGGSIRQPASFCGVVGLKPTYGRVSRYGLVAFASSLDQIGPLTRSVGDAAVMLEVMCGRDARDATSSDAPVPAFRDSIEGGVGGLTIGVPRAFLQEEMGEAVRANFEDVLHRLESEGARVRDIGLPHAEYAVATYYVIANAEASANLARYDGVKYGYRSPSSDELLSMYTNTRGEGFGAEVKRRILLGTYVLSAGYYDAYYYQAQKVRSLVIRDFERAFGECDLIALPTTPGEAFAFGEKTADPITMYMCDVFTIPVNLAGLPAVSVPSGFGREGLPLGFQLIGPALDEETVLRGARGVERVARFEGGAR